jgi:hypothetical protein
MTTKAVDFYCPVTHNRVTIYHQILRYSSIGSSTMFTQHDYGCSRENFCIHRTSAGCRVRELNR